MTERQADNSAAGSDGGLFILLLLALFATGLAVMELFSATFLHIGRIPSALLDSGVLIGLLLWPVWYLIVLSHRPNPRDVAHLRRQRQVLLFLKILATIFVVNTTLMLFEPQLWDGTNRQLSNLIDASLVTLVCAPILRVLLTRDNLQRQPDSLPDLLGTPMGIYVLLLFMVFGADLLQENLMALVLPGSLYLSWQIVDAIITTILVAPALWFLVALPLRRRMFNEQSRIRAIHDQLIDAVVTLDADGRVQSFNPAAERIFAYPAAAVVGRSVNLLLGPNEPQFENLAGSAVEPGNDQGHPFRELSGIRQDGSELVMEVSLSRIQQYGRTEFLLVMRDISSRKEAARALRESENRFREIFEQSEDAIVFFKPGSCSIIDVNNTTTHLFGYNKEELFAEGLDLLTGAADLARLKLTISGAGRGTATSLDTFAGQRKDGEEFVVSTRCKIMTLQGIDLVYCTFRDVTERIQMEKEAREIQAKLIQANKMTSLGLLVSGVAHEINNPNNFILANSGVLARSWDDARKILREYAAENGDFLLGGIAFSELDRHSPELFAGILDGATRINEIVNNLKGFARQERQIAGARFNLNQVATAAVTILHHQLVKFTEYFHLDLAEDLPLVRGSGQQIAQVVINLLMNACQALPGRSHGIWLTTLYDAGAGQVLVTVRDEGCGITPEQGRQIMDPFFTTKLDSGGTGLGLSICQSILREHQGVLEFSSLPGQGTTFTARLPAAEPAKESAPCPQ
ncbi:hypothetical protein JCM30471_10010 [Desulfuromonas carbonis]|uniref:PAS domain-containing sensor histidine kinase n=1 Tax=Desulfuromonas sp. DDH964 TaxID=1823759 RepID=UPI00078ECB55|nr:PAS domain S-box protein [Desulfuromonas sp. DDH964]AMV72484.1 sensor histidine kinase, PAS domain-containing [Desulfuromonas sp. DDH964]